MVSQSGSGLAPHLMKERKPLTGLQLLLGSLVDLFVLIQVFLHFHVIIIWSFYSFSFMRVLQTLRQDLWIQTTLQVTLRCSQICTLSCLYHRSVTMNEEVAWVLVLLRIVTLRFIGFPWCPEWASQGACTHQPIQTQVCLFQIIAL